MLTLEPYQEEGVRFLAANPRAMLLDEQGLGKTPQAIRACDAVGADRVTVVCPPIARIMWKRQFAAWSQRGIVPNVVSYNQLVDGVPAEYECDVLILDEAHYAKNPGAKRTKAVYGTRCAEGGLPDHAGRVWLLSGTLAPNGGHELWTHLRRLWPERIRRNGGVLGYWAFVFRYYFTRTEPHTQRCIILGPRPETRHELAALLDGISLRRMKLDVLKQLPPLRTEVVTLPGRSPKYAPDQAAVLEAALRAFENGRDDPNPGATSVVRRMTGMAKVPLAVEYIKEVLQAEPKVVVFAYHTAVIDALEDKLHRAGFEAAIIRGGQTDRLRQFHIDRFQGDPTVRVLIGQIDACNAVIDLSAASREVFVEYSFTPGVNEQAAARCHRYTTRGAVLASFLTLQGSLDEAIAGVVARKAGIIANLYNHQEPTRAGNPPDRREPEVAAADLAGIDWSV